MKSLRFRLIFWNTTILAMALIALGGAIAWMNLRRMSDGIDRELADRARSFGGIVGPLGSGRGGPGMPPQGGVGGQAGPGAGVTPGVGQGEQDGPRFQGGPGRADSPDGPSSGNPGQQPGFEKGEFGQGPNAGPPRNQRQGGPIGGGPGFRGGQQPGPPLIRDPDADRIAAIRRPRLLDDKNQPLIGMATDTAFDPDILAPVRERGPAYSNVIFRDEQIRVLTSTAPRLGKGYVVQVARELRDYRELAQVQWITLLTVLPFAILFAALGGRFLTGRAMRPIAQMGDAAADIGAGSFDRRIEVAGDDEFSRLGTQFNEMAQRLGHSFAAQKASYAKLEEAYDQQRRFVADASHELRTPLTRLQLTTSEALSDPNSDQGRALQVADDSARSMAKLVRHLLDLARADAGELSPKLIASDLRVIAADAVDQTGLEARLDLPDCAIIAEVDPDQVRRAIINLLENARRHTPNDGDVVVTVRSGSIVVEDTGEGIPPEHLEHVKERFYRVDAARAREAGGSGLGLAIVDEIMRAHGGTLSVESEVGKGTRVSMSFPQKGEIQTDSSSPQANV